MLQGGESAAEGGDLTKERAAEIIAGIRKLLATVPPDGGAAGGEIFTRFPPALELGELSGPALGLEAALRERPLPEGHQEEFERGLGIGLAGMEPAELLRFPELPLGVWAGYVDGQQLSGGYMLSYAERFQGVEMTGPQLEIVARRALVGQAIAPGGDGGNPSKRDPDHLTKFHIRMITLLKKGTFRAEVVRQAVQMLKEQGRDEEAKALLQGEGEGK